MVPYSNFMTMERVYGPSQITRYNLFTSAMITGEPPRVSARVRRWRLSRRSLPRYCPVVTIPNGPVWRRRRKSPAGKRW